MKFHHVTLNTKHHEIADSTRDISASFYSTAKDTYCAIMLNNDHPVQIADGVYAKGVEENDSYCITICTKEGIPILETAGAINKSGFVKIEQALTQISKPVYDEEVTIFCRELPIVYDLILPTCILQPEIFTWTKDFCRCMGIAAFDLMKTKYLFHKFVEDIFAEDIQKQIFPME